MLQIENHSSPPGKSKALWHQQTRSVEKSSNNHNENDDPFFYDEEPACLSDRDKPEPSSRRRMLVRQKNFELGSSTDAPFISELQRELDSLEREDRNRSEHSLEFEGASA